jgi:hypothetical protein
MPLERYNITWEKPVRDRLNHICALPTGWDGYKGQPTRFVVAEFAVQVLRRVCKPDTPAPAIVPLPSGGLQIEWHTDNATIELIVRAHGCVEAWAANPAVQDDEGQEWLLSSDFTVLRPWVDRVGQSHAA